MTSITAFVARGERFVSAAGVTRFDPQSERGHRIDATSYFSPIGNERHHATDLCA
jgi:hypothetical protein